MSGVEIWSMFVNLRDTFLSFTTSALEVLTTELRVVASTVPNDNPVVDACVDGLGWLLDVLGNPSVIELMFGSFGFFVVFSVIKWALDVIF